MPSPRINVLVAGTALPPTVLARLTRAEVRESDCDPSVLALRFSLVQRADGEFGPLDDALFEPGAAIALEIEPPGGLLRRVFDGFCTHLRPHFESAAENAYLEILAMDAAVVLDAQERVAAWPNARDSDVVGQILSGYRITVRADETPVQHDDDRQRLTQRATDWRFLQFLARRNGMRFWLEYDQDSRRLVGHFTAPDVGGAPQPDVTLLQEDACLTWADVQFLATGPVTVAGAAIDPLAKRVVRAAGDPAREVMGGQDAAGAVSSGLTAAGAGAATAVLAAPPPLDEALGAAATAATDDARFLVELRAELDPALYRGLLRARRPVLVRGVGRRFSGVYYVQAVRTTMEEGRLLQTFVALRNATGQSGQEPFGRSAEEVPAT
ncbi:hypothetical protein [Actinomadura sp. 21ATH]|uniref:hypothetical protein n=1 Tax=Actinomadura sp. 21ATH TaxID=1735444 RepID=UPI0035C1DBBD